MIDEAFLNAIKNGDFAKVSEQVSANVDLVKQSDENGATGLHHASFCGFAEIAQLLIDYGADVNAIDDEFGATPAGWAIEHLRRRGALLAIEIEDLKFAVCNNDETWAIRLVNRFPHLKQAVDEDGTLLQHYAAQSSSDRIKALFA